MTLRNALLGLLAATLLAMVAAIIVIVADSDGGSNPPAVEERCDSLRTPSVSAAACAEREDDPRLPGTYVPSQGRSHFPGAAARHTPTPFCDGVSHAGASGQPTTAGPLPTPAFPASNCYASNPPTSGKHLNVQRDVDAGNGALINIPPDPDVYPDDIEIPRDAIPHILEHAGVFVGWNCVAGDAECLKVVERLKSIASDRLDSGDRVVMAHDNDLPLGDIGLAAWTRVDTFSYRDFTDDRAV